MAKIIKEIIIMLLVCLLTMLVLAIALYKFIPNRKVVPEVVTYTASEDIQDLLEDNIDKTSEDNNVISTYEVTASDLSGYQTTNVYVPGKSNPFAGTNDTSKNSESSEANNNNEENNSISNNNTTNSNTVSNSSVKNETTQNNKQNTNPNESNESTTPSVYNKNGTK